MADQSADRTFEDVLSEHDDWLRNPAQGKRAVLINRDLSKLDLRGANLKDADLTQAEIWRTNLKGCRVDPEILHRMFGCTLP